MGGAGAESDAHGGIEVADGDGELRPAVEALQAQLRRGLERLNESSARVAEQVADLDDRLQRLEQGHKSFSGKAEQALDSLWQRTTELGAELAQMPPAGTLQAHMASVEAALAQVRPQVEAVEAAAQSAKGDAESSIASLDAALRQLRLDVEALADAQRGALQSALRRAHEDIEAKFDKATSGLVVPCPSLRRLSGTRSPAPARDWSSPSVAWL